MAQFDQAKNEDINTTWSLGPCPDNASEDVLNFAPTREELIQLIKYWATIVLGDQYFLFLYGEIDLSELRLMAFARCRIGRIATVLGEEAVQRAINEAEEEFSKTVSPRAWSIFKNGTEEERFLFQEEVLGSLYDSCDETSDMDSEGEDGLGRRRAERCRWPIIGITFSSSIPGEKAISL